MLSVIVISLLLALAVHSADTTQEYYVVPSLATCPHKNCTDIATLLSNVERYLTSNARITFQSSIYTIDSTSYLIIQNTSNIVISGEPYGPQQLALFQCYTSFTIIIANSSNVQLSNLKFIGCGNRITHENFAHTTIFNSLQDSDRARNDFTSWFTDLELQTPAQAATVYFLDCTNVTLERVTVRDPTVGIALLEVNNHHYFTVRECHFESGYRAWRLENFQQTSVKRRILYTIEHSRFSTQHNELPDVFTFISSKALDIRMYLYNSTIEGKVTTNGKGYILHSIITNMKRFLIIFKQLSVSGGKAQIKMHDDDPNHDIKLKFRSKIMVLNGYFMQSSLDIDIDQRKPNITVQNISIRNPITSLSIISQNRAYLRNISA